MAMFIQDTAKASFIGSRQDREVLPQEMETEVLSRQSDLLCFYVNQAPANG